MTTSCKVHAMYQARCKACGWSGPVRAEAWIAADDAVLYRATPEHRATLLPSRGRTDPYARRRRPAAAG